MVRLNDREMIYSAAQRFIDAGLRHDDSMFTPGQSIWSLENIDDLYDRIVVHEDTSSDRFDAKLLRQLEDAPADTIQLAAELLYVLLLLPRDMGDATKREAVRKILALQPNPIVIPADLEPAFGEGIARFAAGHSARIYHLRWMLEFLRAWKPMTEDAREQVLSDPWEFKLRVFDISTPYCAMEQEGLIHTVFPDTFEPMVSAPHKREIVRRWASLADPDEVDVDRQLAQLHAGLEHDFGPDFHFYVPVLRSQWQGTDDPWDAFTYWATRFSKRDDYDQEERDYKLQISNNLRNARDALASNQADWVQVLKRAFGSPNNLTSHYMHSPFLRWCEEHDSVAADSLRAIWDDDRSVNDRIERFAELVPTDVVSGPGNRLNLASFLLLAVDPLNLAIYRATPFKDGLRLLEYPPIDRHAGVADQYQQALAFLDSLLTETAKRGLSLRDRLDAQSVLWCVTSWVPPREWGESEVEEFDRFRTGAEPARVTEYWWLNRPDAVVQSGESVRLWEPTDADPGDGANINELRGDDPVVICTSSNIVALGRVAADPSNASGPDGSSDSGCSASIVVEQLERWIPATEIPESYIQEMPDGPLLDDHSVKPADLYPITQTLFEFLTQRSTIQPPVPVLPITSTGTLEDVATELLLDVAALRNIERLLQAKGQVIFYGPPGTGKTYVAQELAKFFTSGGGAYQLVQFHPSYAYEDFVEGYRPTEINGQPGFKREDGPLKRIAEEAMAQPDKTFVLIIDEINRGNVAKVLGELYFLLEYRDQAVSLQYSHEPFELPKNLWIIGTMNTADRTIALIDAALRRRFFFVPFFPDEEPIKGLLGRWLDNHPSSPQWIAAIVDHANDLLADRNLCIGPSYFMRPDLDEDWVTLIWRFQIIPYLQEHFFGEPDRVKEFALERLRQDLTHVEDSEPIA